MQREDLLLFLLLLFVKLFKTLATETFYTKKAEGESEL